MHAVNGDGQDKSLLGTLLSTVLLSRDLHLLDCCGVESFSGLTRR
jgi:hypothetical protein